MEKSIYRTKDLIVEGKTIKYDVEEIERDGERFLIVHDVDIVALRELQKRLNRENYLDKFIIMRKIIGYTIILSLFLIPGIMQYTKDPDSLIRILIAYGITALIVAFVVLADYLISD